MVNYETRFQPLIECIGFLEHFVNEDSAYLKLSQMRLSNDEKALFEEIKRICLEIGEVYRANFSGIDILFSYISKEKRSSLIKILIYEHNDFLGDVSQQLRRIEAYYQEDSKILIKEIIAFENGDALDIIDDDKLVRSFDELLIDDKMKWELWKLQYQVPMIFSQMRKIFDIVLPIIMRHHELYERGYLAFQREIDQAKGLLYEEIAQSLGIQTTYSKIKVIPQLSVGPNLSILEKDKEEQVYMFYSIGMCGNVLKHSEIEDVELCSVMKVMSDKSKFDILRFIADKKAYGAQIASELNLTTATISYHMQALLNVQLICVEKENQRQYYSLNKKVLKEYLDHMQLRLLKEENR